MDLDLRKHAFLVGRLQFVPLFLLKKQVRREKDHLKNPSILGKRNHPLTLLLDLPVSTSLFNSKLATLRPCLAGLPALPAPADTPAMNTVATL